MKRSRSLPFTVSLVPVFLIAVFLAFLGVVELLNMLFHAAGGQEYRNPTSIVAGVIAALVAWCCFMAFKMQRLGLYGLGVVALVLVFIGMVTRVPVIPAGILTALPAVVAFALKDFENME